jgi:hypothetical protein
MVPLSFSSALGLAPTAVAFRFVSFVTLVLGLPGVQRTYNVGSRPEHEIISNRDQIWINKKYIKYTNGLAYNKS